MIEVKRRKRFVLLVLCQEEQLHPRFLFLYLLIFYCLQAAGCVAQTFFAQNRQHNYVEPLTNKVGEIGKEKPNN
ncbi:MAG: hypothetical protein MJ069_04205 [Salinivirgaceae bacterium]|nr:hypothetical protein [Salinivirgaceae bacterium]